MYPNVRYRFVDKEGKDVFSSDEQFTRGVQYKAKVCGVEFDVTTNPVIVIQVDSDKPHL